MLITFYDQQISTTPDETEVLMMSNENHCNWMMFIRLSPTLLEQNCTVYRDMDKFYIVTKTEIKEEELLVWFSAEMCLNLGKLGSSYWFWIRCPCLNFIWFLQWLQNRLLQLIAIIRVWNWCFCLVKLENLSWKATFFFRFLIFPDFIVLLYNFCN